MDRLYWEKIGSGNINLILLHGWGSNIKIWYHIIPKLNKHFTLYLVDLPGFGLSRNCSAITLESIIQILSSHMPKNAIWLGWSLGGLIANTMGLYYPENIRAIINVASSPCFITHPKWPGIHSKKLKNIFHNLVNHYSITIQNFIDLQIFNSFKPYNGISILKKMMGSYPHPKKKALKEGFKILCTIDLRHSIKKLKIPLFRIYGDLDPLVPKKIANILDKKIPNSNSIIIKKSAHAPFITKPKEFCKYLLKFKKSII
ncbi:pimeloyl-ACP methyl ester esterase BioH [Buchnera aphidicola]|uniref:pimeloyl-ACP methyl ester esterase BioH n=1 Tax=Buchnera aphidicola TaxID=9 RepID=UPI0034648FD1